MKSVSRGLLTEGLNISSESLFSGLEEKDGRTSITITLPITLKTGTTEEGRRRECVLKLIMNSAVYQAKHLQI